MKRSRKPNDLSVDDLKKEGYVLFVKQGGGTFRMVNPDRIIKPNQRFWARPDDIPEAFRDLVIPVDEETAKAYRENTKVQKETGKLPPPEEKVETTDYTLQRRGAYYYVLDGDGKQVNEKGMKREEAENLINSLT